MTIVIESGMAFKCSSQTCFQTEKSKTYAAIQNRVKIADFLFLRKNNSAIWCVEAKTSVAREAHPSRDRNQEISDIKDKLLNTFSLYVAMRLNRHSTANELPPEFKPPDLSTVEFQFVLVIAGEDDKDKLDQIKEVLRKALFPTIKTWHLGANPVIVINGDKARERGLIQ
jgi:hypothetical protein